MQMRFYVSVQQQTIIQKFLGRLTFKKWITAAEAVWNHPDYDQGYKGIVDLRDCEIDMSMADIKTMIDLLKNESEKALRAEAAVLVSQPIAAAFATIYSEKMKDLAPANVVLDEEDAFGIVGVDKKTFEYVNSDRAEVIEIPD